MGRHYQRGVALFNLKRYPEAIDAFTEDLDEEPESALALAMRAASWLNFKKTPNAYADVCEALRINPSIGYSHYILSCVRTNQGRVRQAELAAREAIRLEPRAIYFSRLAEIFYSRNYYDEALKTVDEGLSLDPLHASCLMQRAKCLAALGRLQEAKDCLLAVLSHNPEEPAAHEALGRLTLRAGQAVEARESLQEARRLNPISHNDREALAAAYGRLLWPFRVLDRLIIRFHTWPPERRWGWLATISTVLLITSLFDRSKIVTGAAYLIFLNILVAPFTFYMLTTAVGKIVFKRDLDVRWYMLVPEIMRIGLSLVCHDLVSGLAIVCAAEAACGIAVLSIIVNFELVVVLNRSTNFKLVGKVILAICFVFIPVVASIGIISVSQLVDWPTMMAGIVCWMVSLAFSYLLTVRWR